VVERLQQGPGEEARAEVMPGAAGPLPSRWTLRTVRASFDWLRDYTLSGVWYLLQGYDLKLRAARMRQWSPDPAYLPKQEHLLACLRVTAADPQRNAFVFLDEMGFYRWPTPAVDWAPPAPAPPPLARSGGGNNRQWRLIGALNALSGQVDYLDGYIVGRQRVISMYQRLDERYQACERLFVAQDNWSIHKHPDVLKALQGLPRIEPVWLPTYSPWLNPIEKLWRWLRQDVLKMHRLAEDWKELLKRVRAFLDQFADGSQDLLHYVGLLDEGKLAQAIANP
jgi:transposase